MADLTWEPEAPDQSDGSTEPAPETPWTLLLGGLSSAEVLAFGLLAVSAVAALWGTDVLQPQDLINEPWLRALWTAVLLGVLRPITWLPYLGVFAGARRLTEAIAPDASERAGNAGSHVLTLTTLAGLVVLVLLGVSGSVRFLASAIGFLAGAISVDDLGTSLGSWTLGPVVWIALVAVFIRPFLPPVHQDLSPSVGPLFAFADGGRGRIDRALLWASGATAIGLFALALLAG